MSQLNFNKGFVSVLVLLVMSFLSWTGWEVFAKVNSQERNVAYEAQKSKMVFLADSGLEMARASLSREPNWDGGSRQFRGGYVEVRVEKNVQGYVVVVRAEAGKTVQKRSGILVPDANGVLRLKYYGELYD